MTICAKSTSGTVIDDPLLKMAMAEVKRFYGHDIYPRKTLNKYGKVNQFGASETLVSEIFAKNGGILFASNTVLTKTTDVFTLVSSSAGDTGVLTIEGHTIDVSGNKTFVVQTKTLTGTTPATLDTPLAGVTRMSYNSGTTSANTGDIYAFYGSDSSGVPTTLANIANVILAGEGRTLHTATALSQYDYFIATHINIGILKASGANVGATFRARARPTTGSWYTAWSVDTVKEAGPFPEDFKPYYIIPPNHDVAMTVTGTTTGIDASVTFGGYICSIVGSPV